MNDIPKSEGVLSGLQPGSLPTLTDSDAARQVGNAVRMVTKVVANLTTECERFATQRMARNMEAFEQMKQCKSLPEVFTLQTNWFHNMVDDYMREIRTMMEMNTNTVGDMMAQAGQGGADQTADIASAKTQTTESKQQR